MSKRIAAEKGGQELDGVFSNVARFVLKSIDYFWNKTLLRCQGNGLEVKIWGLYYAAIMIMRQTNLFLEQV